MSSQSKHVELALIATLDILGASQMMAEATDASLASLACSLETSFRNAVKEVDDFIKALGKDLHLRGRRFIKTSVFSDTIVISCDFAHIIRNVSITERIYSPEYLMMVYGFFNSVKYVARSLFIDGYPTRACITAGPIITTKHLVVGRPFIESLDIAKELNFAGIVLSESARIIYDITSEKFNSLSAHAPVETHCVWCKHNRRKRLSCLNFLESPHDKILVKNIYQLFSSHGKALTDDAHVKARNTSVLLTSFLRKLK